MLPKRRGDRKRVTLIASFPAQDGVVLCADSQETVPFYDEHGAYRELRKTVQKIDPHIVGQYAVAFAGAGNSQLIDSFIIRARREIQADAEPPSAANLRQLLEDTLADFYLKDVVCCPDEDKRFQLYIAYQCPATKEYGVWVSEQIVLRSVDSKPELMGDRHELYTQTAHRLFESGMTIQQAILAGIRVLTIAEATSNSIRGPMAVAVVRNNGIFMEPPQFIADVVSRLDTLERWVNFIYLASADTSISPKKLSETLDGFSTIVGNFHTAQITRVAQMQVDSGLYIVNDSHPRLPLGTLMTIPESGPITVECDAPPPAAYVEAQKYLAEFEEMRRRKAEGSKQSASHTSEDQPSPYAGASPETESSSSDD